MCRMARTSDRAHPTCLTIPGSPAFDVGRVEFEEVVENVVLENVELVRGGCWR